MFRLKAKLQELNMLFRFLLDLIGRRLHFYSVNLPRLSERRVFGFLIGCEIKHISGPRFLSTDAEDVVLLCVMRNGAEYLKEFIEHHQKLGVKHIVFLDNGSTDESMSIIHQYKNITLLQSFLPFKSYIRIFRLYLKMRFGRDCWSLSIDIDELFDFPFSEKLTLQEFVLYLDHHEFNAVLANMLELIADRPMSNASDGQEILKRENYRYYDNICFKDHVVSSADNREPLREIRVGGIRASYFRWMRGYINKYPLVKFQPGFEPWQSRNHNVKGDSRLADLTCVLMHYQFTQTFHERCKWVDAERIYGKSSKKYSHFLEVMNKNPDVNLYREARNPTEYTGVSGLVESDFVQAGSAFRVYVENLGNATSAYDQ
jgi:hypothetical protein